MIDSFEEFHSLPEFTYGTWATPTQLAPRLYLGSAASAVHHQALHNAGITAVLNCTPDDFGCEAAGFAYYQIPIDDCEVVPPRTVAAALAQLDAWADEDHVVLVHCHAGISRSPSYVIAWWMHRNGAYAASDLSRLWSDALDRVVALRPIVQPHYALKQSMFYYFAGLPRPVYTPPSVRGTE